MKPSHLLFPVACLLTMTFSQPVQADQLYDSVNETYEVQGDQAYMDGMCYPTPECCGLDIRLSASYLYWSVQEDQLGFAMEGIPLSQPTPVQVNAILKTHNPKLDSGVRLDGSISSHYMPVGCRFEWTHFQTTAKAHAAGGTLDAPTVAATTITGTDSPILFTDLANSRWKVNINEYAFDIEYYGYGNNCVLFRPYIGVFGAGIDQTQRVVYSGVNSGKTLVEQDVVVTRKNNFWGVGPRLGLGINWNFCNDFNLISNVNAAYLVGKFDTKNHFLAPVEISNFASIEEKIWRARPMVGGLIGLEWRESNCDSFALTFSISYEFQYWWQQWNSCSSILNDLFAGEGRWGDLSLHGLVVSGGIAF